MIPKPATDWQPMSVRIADCARRATYKVRDEDHEQVLRYALDMEHGSSFPPIRIANIRGKLHVVDGYHRLAASRRLGRETIDALVAKMKASTALAWAIDANATNGLPLTAKDRKPLFAMYMKGEHHIGRDGEIKSGRLIAKELASSLGTLLSHATVRAWMSEYRESQFKYDPDRPKPDRRYDDEHSSERDKIDEVDTSLAYIKRVYWTAEDPTTKEEIKGNLSRMLADIDNPVWTVEDDDDSPSSTLDI